MSGLTKRASAAIAAAVVAVVAGGVQLAGVGGASDSPSPPASPTASARTPGSTAHPADPTASSGGAAGSVPAGAVLFVGATADLQPRGGTDRSYACRAVAGLDRSCRVWRRPDLTVPAALASPLVVLVLAPGDSAADVAAAVVRLPEGPAPRLVLLAPVAVRTAAADVRTRPGLVAWVAAHRSVLVDPVAERWVTPATRDTLLDATGELTAAGHAVAANRLAKALRAAGA